MSLSSGSRCGGQNELQETIFLVQYVLGVRFLVSDFGELGLVFECGVLGVHFLVFGFGELEFAVSCV